MVERYRKAGVTAQTDLPTSVAETGVGIARIAQAGFAELAAQLNQIADRKAVKEGEAEGMIAGLDPEFRPRNDGTLRGDAFDAAGRRVLRTRTDATLRTELARLEAENPDDPIAFSEGAKKLHEKYISTLKTADPAAFAEFDASWPLMTLQYNRTYARKAELNKKLEEEGAAQALLNDVTNDLERQAYSLGLDEAADAVLGHEVVKFQERLAEFGPAAAFKIGDKEYEADPSRSGVMTPQAIENKVKAMSEAMASARIMGTFERLETLDEQETFRSQFDEMYRKGEGILSELSLSEKDALDRKMKVSINEKKSALHEQDAARRALKAEIRSQRSDLRAAVRDYRGFAKQGIMPDPDRMKTLRSQANSLGDTETVTDIDNMVQLGREAQAAMKLPPDALAIRSDQLRAGMKDGASPVDADLLDVIENVRTGQAEGLSKDPYSYAVRAGVIEPIPLFEELPDGKLKYNLAQRVNQARLIDEHYGVQGAVFSREEVGSLQRTEEAGGPELIALSAQLADSMSGDELTMTLRRLSKDAPMLANFAGLLRSGGNPAAIEAAAKGQQLKAENPGTHVPAEASRIAGEALKHLDHTPATQTVTKRTADLIYLGRRGAVGEFDNKAYRQALQEAQGATGEFGGEVRIGGGWFDGMKGSRIIAPTWMRRDAVQTVLEGLTADDLNHAGNGPPRYSDGLEVPAGKLKSAYFVSVAPGRMMAFMNDPEGDDPQPIAGSGPRGFYILDLNRLRERIGSRWPEAVAGDQ